MKAEFRQREKFRLVIDTNTLTAVDALASLRVLT
jgi:hypothetical protein